MPLDDQSDIVDVNNNTEQSENKTGQTNENNNISTNQGTDLVNDDRNISNLDTTQSNMGNTMTEEHSEAILTPAQKFNQQLLKDPTWGTSTNQSETKKSRG